MAVTVTVDAGQLRVAFGGRDAVWALSRGVTVPLARVRGAKVMTRRDALRECPPLRLAGSSWPGRLHAGSYGVGPRRQLWCVHKRAEVLVVDLRGRPYSRIVLEVANPHERAGRINAAVGGRARPHGEQP